MTEEGKVIVRKRRSFSAIPDDLLEDRRLSLDTRLVLGWMVGRPLGWELRISHIRAVLGISQHSWRKARDQLREFGYYRQLRIRGEDGKIKWIREVTDTPWELTSCGNPPSWENSTMDKTMHGESMYGGAHDITEELKQDHQTTTPTPPRGRNREGARKVAGLGGEMSEYEKEIIQAAIWGEEQAARQVGPRFVGWKLEKLRLAGPSSSDLALLDAFRKAARKGEETDSAAAKRVIREAVSGLRHARKMGNEELIGYARLELERLAPGHADLKEGLR